jgi:DNA-binding PadR family transcriptional regulator
VTGMPVNPQKDDAMFMRFHHRHDFDEDDFAGMRKHWRKWLRRKHIPFFFAEGINEHRARRGDVKFIILAALNEKPMHGYDIMRTLEEMHKGKYRPSPGSVYPTLQMLEDGGFVTSEQVDGKRVYTITEAGKKLLAERDSEARGFEDDEDESRGEWGETRDAAWRFIAAARQGIMHENPRIREQVRKVVDEARKAIYKILADEM